MSEGCSREERTGRAGYIKVEALGGKGESGMSGEPANHDCPLSTAGVGHCNGGNMRVLREKMSKSIAFSVEDSTAYRLLV